MSVSQNSDFPDPNPMTVDPTNLGSVDPLSVEGIFLVALSKTGAERGAFLSLQCSDPSQRQRVEALLAAYEQAGNFMEKPVVTAEPVPIGQYLAPCELPGTLGKLGPYEILEEIGRGGMGVVFRAHDPKLQRIVAVKALAPELARLPSARQRFLREARAAAAISHPHVVTIFAVEGTEEASLGTERTTLPFLVMECVVGQTLHDKIKRVGALKVEEIIRISRQIAEGLTAAHKRGLIHRDIKPANILLENGVERVKITDFGLARTTTDGGITHTGEILGTPQCMSPEQARGDIVDQRSDLFSLGCVMYTMCTGVSPFRADNMLAVMKKVCEETPRPVAQLNPELPEWLSSLVHHLLEKRPESRVQSAQDVVQILEARSVGPAIHRPAMKVPSFDEAKPLEWYRYHMSFSKRTLEIAVLSVIIGMLFCAIGPDNQPNAMAIIGVAVWGLLCLIQSLGWASWSWLRWSSFGASWCGLIVGGVAGMMIRMGQSGLGHALFVFGSAIGSFWLLTRWIPRLFHNSSPTPSNETPLSVLRPMLAARQPARSPWSILGWMIVVVIGFVILAAGLVFLAIAIPAYQSRQAKPMALSRVVLETHKLPIDKVIVDGQEVRASDIESDANGRPSFISNAGPHTLHIDYMSDNPQQEKFFHSTVNVPEGTTVVDAVATVSPIIVKPPATAEVSAISIPLADAVEVLTDPKTMPAPAEFTMSSGFGGQIQEMTQAVWIDEPGLLIRMKRQGFEGQEGSEIEYYSKVAWGTGPFMGHNADVGEVPCHFPAGRYTVLVQDLDYGWQLDRRGTITIGNGPLYVHVKRTFQAHQKLNSGSDRFPLQFRWAGRTYQIHTPEEVQHVDILLSYLNQGDGMRGVSKNTSMFAVIQGFQDRQFVAEAIEISPEDGSARLKRERSVMKIDVRSPGLKVGTKTALGQIEWNSPAQPPAVFEAFVPQQQVQGILSDDSLGQYREDVLIPAGELEAGTWIVRRDLNSIRRCAESLKSYGGPHILLEWFGAAAYFDDSRIPVARRLVMAIAEGKPDVPETELLELGHVATLDELCAVPDKKPEETLKALIVPGSTPGTWRLKAPPEGAVQP